MGEPECSGNPSLALAGAGLPLRVHNRLGLDRASERRLYLGELTVSGHVEGFQHGIDKLGLAANETFPDFAWEQVKTNQSPSVEIEPLPEPLEALLREQNRYYLQILESIR